MIDEAPGRCWSASRGLPGWFSPVRLQGSANASSNSAGDGVEDVLPGRVGVGVGALEGGVLTNSVTETGEHFPGLRSSWASSSYSSSSSPDEGGI